MRAARLSAAAAAICAVVAAGCGLGPGKDAGSVDLRVTRDYGGKVLVQKSDSIHESDTALRVLDRSSKITTRFGGGFVQSIDGLAGGTIDGRSTDWFFYVNGIESSVGAAQYKLSDGDRVWWDYRDWTSAMRAPAVVGSWPEPFLHGFQGHRWPAAIECRTTASTCDLVSRRLQAAGIPTPGPSADAAVIEVGPWQEIRTNHDAALLSGAPSGSGVFARFVGAHKPLLELLDQRGAIAGSIGKGGGLVAALRPGDGPPTWVVTGTDARGVASAASLLGPDLSDRYAVATQPGAGPIGVPVP